MTVVLWPARQTEGSAVAAPQTSTKAPTTAPTATVSCSYNKTPGDPAEKDVGLLPNGRTPAGGTVRVTLKTSQGDIPMTFDRAKAPCAIQSFLFLAKKKYFDGTPCRLTASSGLKVLQCGDPGGSGRGGPGYQYDDELPRDLKPAGASAEVVTYPTGTVAMANAGPNTNGSQFFLVYGATTIPPNYPVLGTYGATGQTTLDKVAAGGIAAGPNGPEDGTPNTPVTIELATTE